MDKLKIIGILFHKNEIWKVDLLTLSTVDHSPIVIYKSRNRK